MINMRLQEEMGNISKKDLSPIILKLLETTIIPKYKDMICGVEVTAPWNRETIEPDKLFKHYKILINFKIKSYLDEYDDIINEVWQKVYSYLGQPSDIYSKKYKNCNNIVKESLEDKWTRGKDTVTLKQLLRITKNIPVTKMLTKKLMKHALHGDNPEEMSKIDKTNLKYPVLVLVNDDKSIEYILDGHHRIQKANKHNIKMVNVKLIKFSELPKNFKKVLGEEEDKEINDPDYSPKIMEMMKRIVEKFQLPQLVKYDVSWNNKEGSYLIKLYYSHDSDIDVRLSNKEKVLSTISKFLGLKAYTLTVRSHFAGSDVGNPLDSTKLQEQIRKILREEMNLPPTIKRRINYSEDKVINYLKKFTMDFFLDFKNIDELIKTVCDNTSYEIIESALLHLSDEEGNKLINQVSKDIANNYKDFILNFIKDTLSDDDTETYTFYKHSEKNGGKGFTQSRVGWNKFLEMFGGWFPDLDWSQVKEKLNSLPNGQKLLIKNPLEGHVYEYYFSVSKK